MPGIDALPLSIDPAVPHQHTVGLELGHGVPDHPLVIGSPAVMISVARAAHPENRAAITVDSAVALRKTGGLIEIERYGHQCLGLGLTPARA